MLRTLALTITIAALSGGTAWGQTVRLPLPDQQTAGWLVKHDKDDDGDNGRGRKLGHFKHRDRNDVRSLSRRWDPYAPSPYYGAPPGYGTSYPPPYHDHYGPPREMFDFTR